MDLALVQFAPWDKHYFFSLNGLDLKPGDKVIVKTDQGIDMGEVKVLRDISPKELKDELGKEAAEAEEGIESETGENYDIKPVIRKATLSDIDKQVSSKEKKNVLRYAKELKDKRRLPMKFFDVHFSFDGSRITFAFIADGRVDFRELVKDLTRHFGRTIRLQQIGIRDEARIMGDFGHCGKPLCCKRHLKKLVSITSEMSEIQQCSHRGSERISGICGRLMCCLAYEQEGYEALEKKLPSLEAKVRVFGKRGKVISHNVLKQTVNVEFAGDRGDDKAIVEVELKDIR